MSSHLRELVDLMLRWLHLIAGIMWIGNSLLFNWLDRNLVQMAVKDARDKDAAASGRLLGGIWLLHSGGFYEVEKKFLPPGELPAPLHWFKWQSYTTWLSGIALLVLVYYVGGSAFLVDPAVANLSHGQAVAAGVAFIGLGLLLYDGLWRLVGPHEPEAATLLTLLLGAIAVFSATHLFGGRAAYIHVGVLLGTIMSGNVFLHIIPSQKQLVAATEAGQPQDAALSMRAKHRSIHNNYLTFPLLFIMISNHFASTYGHRHNGWVLVMLIVGGASVRHILNIRFGFPRWRLWLGATLVVLVAALYLMVRPSSSSPGGAIPKYSAVEKVIKERCQPCHSAHPTDPQWQLAPSAVMFDTPAQVRAYAERIRFRAVQTRTMPLGNKTGMLDTERELLERWLAAGAPAE